MQNMNPGLQSARGRAHARRSRMLIASVRKRKKKKSGVMLGLNIDNGFM